MEKRQKAFHSVEEFKKWLRHYRGTLKDKITIIIPNDHGNPIEYSSPIEALEAHEE